VHQFVLPRHVRQLRSRRNRVVRFPFTDTPFFSPYAEQPSSGNQPLCDIFVGPFCEPGPIANNDDRMNEVKTVKPSTTAAHNWGGVNTDALVADPIGKLHRRSAIAYFDISATAFARPFVVAGKVNSQGYIANWNNDVVFPAIAVRLTADGTPADRLRSPATRTSRASRFRR
jgi:hypothetical protein